MRKALLLVVLLLLASMVSVVRATPIEELTSLAEYFPGDTLAYATIRTDDGYFEEIDSVIAQVNANFDGQLLPPEMAEMSSRDLFAEAAFDGDTTVLDWLGDSLAIGIPGLDVDALMMGDMDEFPFLIAAQIDDVEAAAAFFGLADAPVTDAGYRLQADSSTAVLLAEDVLLLGTVGVDVEAAFQRDGTLAANEDFIALLDAMPEAEYNAFGYFDATGVNESLTELTTASIQAMGMDDDMGSTMMGLNNLLMTNGAQDAGQLAFGLTLLDGRTLTADLVFNVPESQMMMMPEQVPVDLEFAGRVPAEAELVIHSTNFGGQMLAQFAALDTIMPQLQMTLDMLLTEFAPEDEELPEDLRLFLSDLITEAGLNFFVQPEDLVDIVRDIDLGPIMVGGILENQITPIFAGFTGLNLRDDVLDWMTGDYAIWLSLYPVESDLDFTVDLGYATVATSPEEAAYIVERLTEALGLYGLGHFVETIGGGDALVFSAPVRAITALMLGGGAELNAILAETPELDLIFGANDDVFTFSSRPGAAFALTGEGDSLLDDPAFTYAVENLFLENTNSVLWVSTAPLADDVLEIFPALEETLGADGMQGFDQAVIALANAVESATITSTLDGNVGTARLTLTVPAEPYGEVDMNALMGVSEPQQGDVFTQVMTGSRFDTVTQNYPADGMPSIGDPAAPVTVELYSSFSCPPCGNYNEQQLGSLIDYAANGDILLEYYPFEIFETDVIAGVAAQCAADQFAFWEMQDAIYDLQRMEGAQAFTSEAMVSAASSIGMIDMTTFETCLEAGDTSLAELGTSTGQARGITGTPGMIVNGERLNNAFDYDMAIQAALGQ